MFRALVVEKDADGNTQATVQEVEDARLPEGDVTVAVEYSTLNYKDGLCLGPGGWAGAVLAACAGDRLRRNGRGIR
jgi:acrylyl-CoA reductase (NADPH)